MDPIPEAIYIRTNDVTVVHQSQLHKNVGCTGYPGFFEKVGYPAKYKQRPEICVHWKTQKCSCLQLFILESTIRVCTNC